MTRSARPSGVVRRRAVLTLLGLGAGILGVSSATWVRALTATAVEPEVDVLVSGSVAAPGVTAGGLVVAAAALALALGGRWGRRLSAGAVVLGGGLVVASSLGVVVDPVPAATSAARAATGVGDLTAPATATSMPVVALLLGCVSVLVGGWVAVVSGGWQGPGSRHDPHASPVGGSSVADGSGAGSGARSGPSGPPDDHADWDALTRGDDPT